MLTGIFCLRKIQTLRQKKFNRLTNQGLKVHIMFTRAAIATTFATVQSARGMVACAAQGYQMNVNSIGWSSVDTHNSAKFARRDEVVHRDSEGIV